MPKFTALIELMSNDYPYIEDALIGSRFKLMNREDRLFALTYGESKNKYNLGEELESELVSLGVYAINTEVYFELKRGQYGPH